MPSSSRARLVQRDQAEYEAAFGRLLRSVRAADRRQGLLNLFWLATSRDVAEFLRELEAKNPGVKRAKYSLHPLLSSFYRRLDQECRKGPAGDPGTLLAHENPSLVESVIEDGFAFTEVSASELDFNQFLAANKRYRLSAECFFEIQLVLVRETERRLREGDRGLLTRVARHLPGLPRDQYLKPGEPAQGDDERADPDLPARRPLDHRQPAHGFAGAEGRGRAAQVGRRSSTPSWTSSRTPSASRSCAGPGTGSASSAPSAGSRTSRTRRAAASGSTSSASRPRSSTTR